MISIIFTCSRKLISIAENAIQTNRKRVKWEIASDNNESIYIVNRKMPYKDNVCYSRREKLPSLTIVNSGRLSYKGFLYKLSVAT